MLGASLLRSWQKEALRWARQTEFPSESAVRKSAKVQALLLGANAESPMVGMTYYGNPRLHVTKLRRCQTLLYWVGVSVIPQVPYQATMGGTLITGVKPMAVEDWLNRLKLAPKTKSHIKQLMHVIFECAMRWELTDKNPISLVRVKGGSKRLRHPRILGPEEFGRLVACDQRTIQNDGHGCRVSRSAGQRDRRHSSGQTSTSRTRPSWFSAALSTGRVGDVKTEYSKDHLPLDPALVDRLLRHRERCYPTAEGWLFANPETGRPYHQEQIQKKHLPKAATDAGIEGGVGWHTFRHSYRSWMDDTGAPLTVQKELMRHASVTTTMNVYGKAMTDSKRQAHSKVVQMVLKSKKSNEATASEASWLLLGANGSFSVRSESVQPI